MNPMLITSLVSAAVAFGLGWSVNGMRLGEQIADIKRTRAESIAQGVKDALQTTTELQGKKDAAIKTATARNAALATAADNARAESERLRDELAKARTDIANASDSSVRQYATTLGSVFTECGAALEGMARKADGHASDARTLIDAWPKKEAP